MLPAKSFVKQVVFWSGREIFLPADYMRNFHQVVVHHVGKIVGGEAIGFEQHLVIELFVLNGDVPIDMIIITADAFQRNALAHDRHQSFREAGCHLLRSQVAAWVAVAFHAFIAGFEGRFVFLTAEAVVGMSTRNQLLRIVFINWQALTLHIRAKTAVLIRPFIIADARQGKPAIDRATASGRCGSGRYLRCAG